MRDVFPDAFGDVNYDNLENAVKAIEGRLRYAEECVDFAVKTTKKLVDRTGESPVEVTERLDAVELAIGELMTAVGSLQTTVNTLAEASAKSVIKHGIMPPTPAVVGAIGQLYIDTSANELYYCSAYTSAGYVWTALT